MNGFTIVDGFLKLIECVAEMIKCIANEPSVGLFYMQQHIQNSVPKVMTLRNKIKPKCHMTNLHTQDLEDSIALVQSMKKCGVLTVEELILDIETSLSSLNVHTNSGLARKSILGFPIEGTRARGYVGLNDSGQLRHVEKGGGPYESRLRLPIQLPPTFSATGFPRLDKFFNTKKDTPMEDVCLEEISMGEDYDDFRADKEAKLEEWLEGHKEA